jgi:hypothetical protein
VNGQAAWIIDALIGQSSDMSGEVPASCNINSMPRNELLPV